MQIVLGINTAEFSATSTWVVCRIKDSSEHNVLYTFVNKTHSWQHEKNLDSSFPAYSSPNS